ncbi:MAG: pentapeptide repeat-containing protein [Methanocorpusculum sp.]|nr:pentapeptide repeat-containing protein [Methanocorpusculum sp.]
MKKRFDKKQYELLGRAVKSGDFSLWNEWYAAHLKEMLYLRSTDAYGAHLDGADLSYMYLEGVNLRFASLKGADLSYTYLKGADLEGADLSGANLWRAYLAHANLAGTNPDAALYEPGERVKFDEKQAELLRSGVAPWNEWYRLQLFEGAEDVKHYGAYLEEASFVGLDLPGVNLAYAHLEGADLRQVNLSGANLLHAHLEGADLWRANLTNANLRWAELGGANLSGADITGAKF